MYECVHIHGVALACMYEKKVRAILFFFVFHFHPSLIPDSVKCVCEFMGLHDMGVHPHTYMNNECKMMYNV